MSHSVRRHLRLDVDAYDASIRRFIPSYEAMLARAADEVARVAPGLVVELGAGTAALSAAVLARPSVGAVVLLDIDPEMLGLARERVATFGDRARPTLGSFFDDLPACDAVMASLALHHIAETDRKAQVYRRIHAALPPGGVFVNADVMMPTEGPVREMVMRRWADHLVASGIPEERAWAHFAEWAEEDTYVPVAAELDLLERTGFQARCVWRDEPSTVIVGVRA